MADGPAAERLAAIVVADGPLAVDLRPVVLRAAMSTSTTQSSQLTLSLADPELALFLSGRLAKGTRVRYAGLDLAVRVRSLEVRSTGPQLTVVARSRVATAMKASKGARTWSGLSPDSVVAERVRAAGGTPVCEPRPQRRSIVRRAGTDGSADEDDWALADRLASEEQAIRFDVGSTVYWGRPSWLATHLPVRTLAWSPPGRGDLSPALLEAPQLRDSDDDDSAEVTGSVRLLWSAVPSHGPGAALDLTGVGSYSGRYLSTGASWDVLENEGSVDLASPIDPEAVKQADDTTAKGKP